MTTIEVRHRAYNPGDEVVVVGYDPDDPAQRTFALVVGYNRQMDEYIGKRAVVECREVTKGCTVYRLLGIKPWVWSPLWLEPDDGHDHEVTTEDFDSVFN